MAGARIKGEMSKVVPPAHAHTHSPRPSPVERAIHRGIPVEGKFEMLPGLSRSCFRSKLLSRVEPFSFHSGPHEHRQTPATALANSRLERALVISGGKKVRNEAAENLPPPRLSLTRDITSLLAMGNDGGSIPTRRELVKEAARNPSAAQVKESQHEQQEYQWTTDPISRQPLVQPVVSDSSGKLYNKATILEYLVEGAHKEDFERETQGAVKSLKDVVEVKFELDTDSADGAAKKQAWKCPVTGDKLGAGSKAVYIVPCGHAFSGAAIKEVSGEKCLTCDVEYASNDIIPINSLVDTDIARLSLRAKTLQEKGLSHSLKKASSTLR